MALSRNSSDVTNPQPRGETGASLSSFPVATELASNDGSRVYVGRVRPLLMGGAISIAFSLVGLTQVHAFLNWYHGGPVPKPDAFWILGCLLLFPFGLVLISSVIRGLPRLAIGPQGFSLQQAFNTKWANWDSVAPFVVKTTVVGRLQRQVKTATSTVTGPNASGKISKPITILDAFGVNWRVRGCQRTRTVRRRRNQGFPRR